MIITSQFMFSVRFLNGILNEVKRNVFFMPAATHLLKENGEFQVRKAEDFGGEGQLPT